MMPVSTSPMPGAAMPGLPAVQSQFAPVAAATKVPAPFSAVVPS